MLIECPACHARARISDQKEGAKVRCGECGRIYLAAAPGTRARVQRSGRHTGIFIGLGVAALALLGLVLISNPGEGNDAQAAILAGEAEPEPELQEPDEVGWDAAPVQAAVRIHEAAFAADETRLRGLLDGPAIHAREAAGGEQPPDEPDSEAMEAFLALDTAAAENAYARWIDDLVSGEGKELVADWRPYDGRVLDRGDSEATVRIDLTRREPNDGTKRSIDWHMILRDSRWRAWRWERYISPEERKANRKPREKGYEEVTLADGSVVFEREPEPLEHFEDTPAELRGRIDRLYATMLDLELTKEAAHAQRELEDIGRPAIPVLLTGLFRTPLDTEENAIRCNLIVQTLRTITGQYFGYKPQVLQGSGLGTTEERRQSAIKQWFAWWYRNGDDFQTREVEDALEGMIQLSDKEKAWLERNKD